LAAAECELGDFREYGAVRAEIAELRRRQPGNVASDRRAEALHTLSI
jgi:hypothetical protein